MTFSDSPDTVNAAVRLAPGAVSLSPRGWTGHDRIRSDQPLGRAVTWVSQRRVAPDASLSQLARNLRVSTNRGPAAPGAPLPAARQRVSVGVAAAPIISVGPSSRLSFSGPTASISNATTSGLSDGTSTQATAARLRTSVAHTPGRGFLIPGRLPGRHLTAQAIAGPAPPSRTPQTGPRPQQRHRRPRATAPRSSTDRRYTPVGR